MNKELPELPPRFRWDGLCLQAYDTLYYSPKNWESISHVYDNGDGTYDVSIWQDDTFVMVATALTSLKEAANYAWTLVQLGEVHFTFREEENERTK